MRLPSAMSWGRWPRQAQQLIGLHSRFDALPELPSMLAHGNGRSYGDVCQNAEGALLLTRGLNRFIAFDTERGLIDCEAGVLLGEIIDLALPHGWFPAVTPGTAFVSVGGAIANDVHGKNHHRVGCFGHHLQEFELQRSDGSVRTCSPERETDLFHASIGGLGLTGLVRRARLQLRRVPGPWISGDSLRFNSLAEFLALASESDRDYEYTVAWIDCSDRAGLGRGIFMRGNHVAHDAPLSTPHTLRVPFAPPFSPLSRLTVRAFNSLYFSRGAAQSRNRFWDYRSYLYPLDRVLDWNRIYGQRGFYQYQCVLPQREALTSLSAMLGQIARSGQGSALSVLKRFGDTPSLGLLSFARPGVSLALDFPNRGASTLALLESLDAITRSVGGAVYPAKDARMSGAAFRQYFPGWESFQQYVDPRFSSSFWRRVTQDAA